MAAGVLAEQWARLRCLYILPRGLWTSFAIYFPLGFINVTSFKLYLPLLRSLVVCEAPVDMGSSTYSGSPYCGDQNLVLSIALQQEAWLVGIKLALRMCSGPILGALCDTHGRKPILTLSIGGITLAFLLMWLACVQRHVAPMPLLTLALAIQGSTTAFGLCFRAMIADSLQAKERAKGFVVLGHVDVLSRGCTLAFVIYVQKARFVHYGPLCLAAFCIGLTLLLCCHLFLEETLRSPASPTNGQAQPRPARANGRVSELWQQLGARLQELAAPWRLLVQSGFLQLRLLQTLLMQLGAGWESVQDSFMISVLGWEPGDWDLANVPISSFREVWGMLTSGVMVQWAADRRNSYLFVKASLAFGSLMMLLQTFAPFGAVFMLLPRCLLAFCPSDGGADAAFFSAQFPSEAQASASGLLTATDNLVSGVARWLYARFLFVPAARGWAATAPLVARMCFTYLGNALCVYLWWRYGLKEHKKPE
mmetsp:Transcript_77896/g.215279  ORF Transcript_77896/g.215279 Transcript_77896/m.215279 type:complete len:479 (-) Transcript_77896:52-1488(-)